jgi:MFS family permease
MCDATPGRPAGAGTTEGRRTPSTALPAPLPGPVTGPVTVDPVAGADGVAQGMFHGWKVAGAGAVILALQSALILQAFGSYAVILQERFGWSRTTISVAYSFNRAESGLLGPLHGWALHRFGSRRVMRVGAVVLMVGFVWFSQMSRPAEFVASFFVIAVGAGLSGFLTVNTETVRWFEAKRARALSLTAVGLAAGGLLAPAVVLALRVVGWRETALVSGLVLGVGILVLSSLFGSSPAERGVPVDGVDRSSGAKAGRRVLTGRHLSAGEAVRTRAFWLLAFGHASALLVVGSVIAHLSLFLTAERGFTLQQASFVIAGIPVAQIAGMLLGGVLGDQLSKRLLCSAAMFGHVAGLLLLTFSVNQAMVWAFVVLHGMAWGMRGPLMSAIRADYFGSTAFGQIMGYSSLVLMFGMVGGPLFAGVLADVTGSYRTGFTILAGLSATGSLLFALATPPSR